MCTLQTLKSTRTSQLSAISVLPNAAAGDCKVASSTSAKAAASVRRSTRTIRRLSAQAVSNSDYFFYE